MTLIYLILAFLGLLISGWLLWKYPVAFAVSSIAAGILADAFQIGESGFQLGVTLYPGDLICAALLVCCIVTFIRTRSWPEDFCWPALILLGLGIVNFARGVLLFGVNAPGNGARDIIYFILPVVAFPFLNRILTVDTKQLVTCLSITSLVFAVIAAARWAGVLALPDIYDEDFREIARVLPSDYAIVIGQAFIGVCGIQLLRGFRITGLILTMLFAGLVLALQHRSVWIATAAGLAWLAMRSPRLAQREWLQFVSLVLLLASALTLVALFASGPLEKGLQLVHSNVEEVGQEDSTWNWRVEGYVEATQRVFSNGLTEAVIGPPSGRDLSNIAKSPASIHIHDRFVFTLANYGVLGLFVLLAWLASTAGRIRLIVPHDHSTRVEKTILEAMLVSTVVYLVPYSGGQLQGALMGAVWLASTARQALESKGAFAPRPARVLRVFTGGSTVGMPGVPLEER